MLFVGKEIYPIEYNLFDPSLGAAYGVTGAAAVSLDDGLIRVTGTGESDQAYWNTPVPLTIGADYRLTVAFVDGDVSGFAGIYRDISHTSTIATGNIGSSGLTIDFTADVSQVYLSLGLFQKNGFIDLRGSLMPQDRAPPVQAVKVGYIHRTFFSDFERSLFDNTLTRKPGLHWRPRNFQASYPPYEDAYSWNDNDGSFTLNPQTDEVANVLLACSTAPNGQLGVGWRGLAFGGGLYAECRAKFDPTLSGPTSVGFWPTIYWLPIEQLSGNTLLDHWLGQSSNYENYVEWDMMEYQQLKNGSTTNPETFTHVMHNWHGASGSYSNVATPSNRLVQTVNEGIDWTADDGNRIGGLWLSATVTGQGATTPWINDAEYVGESWSALDRYKAPPPVVGTPGTAFGCMDRLHMVPILVTGRNQPFTFFTFSVWQKDGLKNWMQ